MTWMYCLKLQKKNQNKSYCERAWSRSKDSSCSNASIHFFLYQSIVSCNLFTIFSELIEYFLMSLTISFAIWWSLISNINWFIVSSDHLRFINFMLSLARSWRFSALISKTFKFCHALFWWAADGYYAQILTSRTNSTAKFFKRLYCYNIRFRTVLNLW